MNVNRKFKSLSSRFSLFTVIIIFFQSTLLIGTLVAGGVLKQTRENAFDSFRGKVVNRTKFIQSELDNRWTNISPYVKEISTLLSNQNATQDLDEVLLQSSRTLVDMLRITGTTGAFLLLNDADIGDNKFSAIYLRDYDPKTNNELNNDLYLVMGPKEISRSLQIPMDRLWKYEFELNDENGDFFQKPLEATDYSNNSNKLGYWSKPFKLNSSDEEIITYSVPIFDLSGDVYGVMGVEISLEYLKTQLPANELALQDSLGYMLAIVNENSDFVTPLLYKGAYQQRVFKGVDKPKFLLENKEYEIYQLKNGNISETIFSCMQPLALYNQNVPYEKEKWVVIGMMEENTLFLFLDRLKNIFMFSFCIALLFGVLAGYLFSKKLTKPIVCLAEKVRNNDITEEIQFQKTGLTEIDDLTNAIEISNRNLFESTVKMSQIMELANVQIGAFEYRIGDKRVLVTNKVFDLLGVSPLEEGRFYVDSNLFLKRLNEVLGNKEMEEENIYLSQTSPEQWVKIKLTMNENSSLGVIQDVTKDMKIKVHIKEERDYDYLTKLYGRAAFEREVKRVLNENNVGVAAFVMFDLDGLKGINDTFGHEYGDIYIKEAAKRLHFFSGDQSIAGRRSGDEFYVFFYGFNKKEEIIEKLDYFYRELKQSSLKFPDCQEISIKISAGISWFHEDANNYEEMVLHSDHAMYEIKHTTKGTYGEFH